MPFLATGGAVGASGRPSEKRRYEAKQTSPAVADRLGRVTEVPAKSRSGRVHCPIGQSWCVGRGLSLAAISKAASETFATATKKGGRRLPSPW